VSRLRVHNVVVSLDGFATGEGQSQDAGFGHAQQAFGEWFEKLRIWRGLQPDGRWTAGAAGGQRRRRSAPPAS
jgi:hypothetical protein